MKNLKVGLLICGVLGLVGMVMSGLGVMLEHDKLNAIVMLLSFGLPAVMAAAALRRPPLQSWQAGVALAGFVLAAVKLRVWDALRVMSLLPAGYLLMMVGAGVGVIVAIAVMVKPDAA